MTYQNHPKMQPRNVYHTLFYEMIKNIIETRKLPHGVLSLCGCVNPLMRMIDDPFKNSWNYVNSETLGIWREIG